MKELAEQFKTRVYKDVEESKWGAYLRSERILRFYHRASTAELDVDLERVNQDNLNMHAETVIDYAHKIEELKS